LRKPSCCRPEPTFFVAPRLFFRHPEASAEGSPIPKEGRFLATLEMKRLVGDASLRSARQERSVTSSLFFSSPRGVSRGVSNSQRRKVSRYARNEKISRRCLAKLGTTGEECHLEPLFFRHPEASAEGSSWGRYPERSEGCLATARQDKKGCSAGQGREGTFLNNPTEKREEEVFLATLWMT
jgi:hypothetical protein